MHRFLRITFLLSLLLSASCGETGDATATLQPSAVPGKSAPATLSPSELREEEREAIVSDADPKPTEKEGFQLESEPSLRGRVILEGDLPADETMSVVLEAYRTPDYSEASDPDLARFFDSIDRHLAFVEVARAPVTTGGEFALPRALDVTFMRMRVEGDYVFGGFLEFEVGKEGDPAFEAGGESKAIELTARLGGHVTFVLDLPPDTTDAERVALTGLGFLVRGDPPRTNRSGGSPFTRGGILRLDEEGVVIAEAKSLPAWEHDHVLTPSGNLAPEANAAAGSFFPFFVDPGFSCTPLAGQRTRVVVPMERGFSFSGVVQDESGAPVPEAKLNVESTFSDRGGSRRWHGFATTDATGAFVLEFAGEHVRKIEVTAKDMRPLTITAGKLQALLGKEAPAILTLSAGASLHLKILLPDGTPVVKLPVVASWHGSNTTGVTNAQGELHLRGLDRGEYRITASGWLSGVPSTEAKTRTLAPRLSLEDQLQSQRFALSSKQRITEEMEASLLELTMQNAPELHGQIEDFAQLADGDVSVQIVAKERYDSMSQMPGMAMSFMKGMDVPVDPGTGRFQATLTPGSYVVFGMRGHGNTGTQSNVLEFESKGGVTQVSLRFPSSAEWRGRVIDENGDPVAGAEVRASRRGVHFLQEVGKVHSGADGSFTLPLPNPGEYLFGLRAAEHILTARPTVHWREGELPGDLILSCIRGGFVHVEAFDESGAPLPDLALTLRNSDGSFARGPQNGKTDEDGTVRLGPTDPGLLVCSATLGEDGLQHRKIVEVVAGETALVRFDALEDPVATCSGWITVDGEPAEDYLVTVSDAIGILARATTAIDGRYEVKVMSVGEVRLDVESDLAKSKVARRTLTLSAGSNAVEDIDLPSASIRGSIDGKIGFNEGFGLYVAAMPLDHPEESLVRSYQPSGSEQFYLPHLAPGRYRLCSVRYEGSRIPEVTDVLVPQIIELAEGEALTGVVLRLSKD